MGLQAAARVSQDSSAFAFVWNAPEAADSTMWDPKPQVTRPARTKKAKGRTPKIMNPGPLRFPGFPAERVHSLYAGDLDHWMNAMSRWIKQKHLPPGRWKTRESWEAVPISPSLGSFGIYRIDDLNEFHKA
jgi:hypothetical protein